jgi:hypothetical protein
MEDTMKGSEFERTFWDLICHTFLRLKVRYVLKMYILLLCNTAIKYRLIFHH